MKAETNDTTFLVILFFEILGILIMVCAFSAHILLGIDKWVIFGEMVAGLVVTLAATGSLAVFSVVDDNV